MKKVNEDLPEEMTGSRGCAIMLFATLLAIASLLALIALYYGIPKLFNILFR
jgi:hypothetical protein